MEQTKTAREPKNTDIIQKTVILKNNKIHIIYIIYYTTHNKHNSAHQTLFSTSVLFPAVIYLNTYLYIRYVVNK